MGAGLYPVEGPKTYQETYNTATLNGALGKAHQYVDASADKLIHHSDEFALAGPKFQSRKELFCNTVKTFFNASGSVGSIVGTATMLPLDLVTGRGSAPCQGERGMFLDEGILGNGAKLVGTATSAGVEYIGKGAGAGAAAVGIAAKDTDGSSKAWIKEGAGTGGKFFGRGTGVVLGGSVGLAADAVRLPSIIVKGTLKGVSAVLGGIVGFFAGSVRAIINK